MDLYAHLKYFSSLSSQCRA